MTTTTSSVPDPATAQRNVETLQAIFAAFGRGDVPGILELLTDDVTFDAFPEPSAAQVAGIDYLQPARGHDEVAAFFTALAQALEINEFSVGDLIASGDKVVAEITLAATVRATGRSFRDTTELHLWTFAPDGRACALRHVLDTAKHIDAHRP